MPDSEHPTWLRALVVAAVAVSGEVRILRVDGHYEIRVSNFATVEAADLEDAAERMHRKLRSTLETIEEKLVELDTITPDDGGGP